MIAVMFRFIVFIVLAALAGPATAEAQPASKVYRIGILGNARGSQGADLWGAFVQRLRELGYVEGQNLAIEERYSEGRYERLPALARELVDLKVDVIVVPAIENARAAEEASRTIPIVGASLGDPVQYGLVASFAHPGGNITGLSFGDPQIAGKQVELVKEMLPRLSRVAILANPTNPAHSALLRQADLGARALRLQLQVVNAQNADEFRRAFAAIRNEHAGAVVVLADGLFLVHRAEIVQLATKDRVPAMYGLREYIDVGGLAFYGHSLRDNFRRAATYVDKILKGAKPADLPIEQPAKFELVINLKTAKALGITIPQSLLLRADEVIQ